jgi:hypothetical protein
MHRLCTGYAQVMHRLCTGYAQVMHRLCTGYAQVSCPNGVRTIKNHQRLCPFLAVITFFLSRLPLFLAIINGDEGGPVFV